MNETLENNPFQFMRYVIAQRAILNGIYPEERPTLKNTQFIGQAMKIRTEFTVMIRRFKWFLRDNILKGMIKTKIVLIGTGGHAKVIVDIINKEGKYEIVGCTTSDTDSKGFEGLRIFGTDEILPIVFSKGVVKAFVAIGDNRIRKKVIENAEKMGFELVTVVHPSAQVAQNVHIGQGTCIMPGAIINPHSTIGKGSIINTNTSIDHDCTIENWVHIAPGTSLAGCVVVGEGTLIGAGASIIPGVEIGMWSVVGAGGVVLKKIPNNTKVYGVPARVREKIH